jgi:hypothetical protein
VLRSINWVVALLNAEVKSRSNRNSGEKVLVRSLIVASEGIRPGVDRQVIHEMDRAAQRSVGVAVVTGHEKTSMYQARLWK